MQLTDAEIREILRRRKIEKIRRQKRRRRITLIVIAIIIVAAIVLIKVLSGAHAGKNGSQDGKNSAVEPGSERGIIFIDPGHGGDDPGSDDDKDRYEKNDTLKLSLAIRDQLQSLGYKVEMSRTDDATVERAERGKMANKCGAQLFVSIHRNKASTDGRGIEGFIPKKNEAQSRLLGENIIHFLGKAGFTERTIRAGTLNDPNDDYEEMAVTKMPSALMEIGFLSNATDNALFDDNLDKNARAIAAAIDYTFTILYDPDNADAYTAKLDTIDKTANTVQKNTQKAVEDTAAATHREPEDPESPEEEDGGSTGIDPEA